MIGAGRVARNQVAALAEICTLEKVRVATRSEALSPYFIGLPIPLAAGTLISLIMLHQRSVQAPLENPQGPQIVKSLRPPSAAGLLLAVAQRAIGDRQRG